MKLFFSFLLMIFFTVGAKAQSSAGIGGMIGSPTGISGFFDVERNTSIAWALAYNFWSYSGLHIHGDYLFNNEFQFRIKTQSFEGYYGVGGRLIFINRGDDKDKMNLGVRVPLGFNYYIKTAPAQIFAEIVPVLNVVPKTDVTFDLGVGARYLF